MAVVVRNRFHPLIGVALALIVIIGFSRTYYLRFLSDLPPLVTLVHLHGLVFTAWLALFVTQAQFIRRDRVDLHMKLGIAGAVLAAAIVILGVATAFHTAAIPRVRGSGLTPTQFAIVPLVSITTFAILVGSALALRRRADFHKRLMVLAMMAVIGPAIGRIMTLFSAGKFTLFVVPLVTAGFVAWCLIHDWRRHRIVHPVYLVGGATIVALWPVRQAIARSDWWQPIGEWIGKVGAGV